MNNAVRAFLALFAAMTLASAANAQWPGDFGRERERQSDGNDETTSGGSSLLRARIRTDQSQYTGTRAVEIYLSLENLGRSTQVLELNRIPEYEITIREARTGREVKRFPKDARSLPVRRITLSSGETVRNREFWDRTDESGRRVPSGAYTVEARIYPKSRISTQIYLGDRDNGGRDEWGNGGGNGGSSRPPLPGDLPRPGGGSGGRDTDYSDLQTDLRSNNSSVRAGDSVRLTYTVRNRSDRSRTVRFPSGQQFDVEAVGDDRRQAWMWSQNLRFTQSLTEFTIGRGETKTFTADWHVTNEVPNGVYTVSAYLTPGRYGRSNGVGEASTQIRVSGGSSRPSLPGGIGGRRDEDNDGRGNGGGRNTTVSLRDIARSSGDWLGRRVRVSGTYKAGSSGWSNGDWNDRNERNGQGSRSERSDSQNRRGFFLEDGGERMFVVGAAPSGRDGSRVEISGIVARTMSGRVYIDADGVQDNRDNRDNRPSGRVFLNGNISGR